MFTGSAAALSAPEIMRLPVSFSLRGKNYISIKCVLITNLFQLSFISIIRFSPMKGWLHEGQDNEELRYLEGSGVKRDFHHSAFYICV